MGRRLTFSLVLSSLLAAPPLCAQEAAALAPAAVEAERPPVIPAAAFAARNQFSDAKLSPDGRRIAMRLVKDGTTMLSVVDADSRKSIAAAGIGETVSLEWHRWAGPDRVLFAVGQAFDFGGDETYMTRLFVLDLATGRQHYVGPKRQGAKGDDLLWTAPDGSAVLLAFQPSIYDWPSVYRFDLGNPEDRGTLVQAETDGIWDWYADDAGVVRMGLGYSGRKLRVIYRRQADEKFATVARIGKDDEDKIWDVMRIVGDSDTGYVLDEDEDGRTVLKRFDYAARQPLDTVHRNEDWDLTSAVLDRQGKPVAVYFTDDRDRVVWLDPELAKLQRDLEKALSEDEVWVSSRAEDNSRMLIFAGGEADPGALYLFDKAAKKLDVLAEYRPQILPELLARPKPVDIAARDGSNMRSYLTLPRGREPRGLPLIVMPHGGPYGVRDKLAYDDEVQLLANRGYAVLQPNYRGSGGFGDAFEELGNGQIGRAMQDDIDDAMDLAVEQGIADRGRVCVVGSSYGGYAAMWAVIRNPERYRCAASFAGVSDWKRQLRYDANFFTRKGSRKWRDRVRGADGEFDLDLVAPAENAAKLTRPLLLAHGKRDTNVPFSQFRMMEKAAAKAGAPVETLVFDEAGHGFYKPADEEKWYEALAGFLLKHNPPD